MPTSARLPGAAKLNKVSKRSEDHVDTAKLGRALWRGKWLITAVSLAFVGMCAFYVYRIAQPIYQASVVVIMETSAESIVDFEGLATGFTNDTSVINSEVEVLRSRSLMALVAQRLDLLNDAEFNPSGDVTDTAFDQTIDTLLTHIEVYNVPKSLVFRITASSVDPAKAALIADTFAQQYVLNQIDTKYQATEQATTWLTGRVGELQTDLELAETQVRDFTARTDLIDVETLAAMERQLKDSRDRVQAAEVLVLETSDQLDELHLADTLQAKVAAAQDPTLARAQGNADLFNARYDRVLERANSDVTRSAAQLESLREATIALEARIETQSRDLITLQQLNREAEASRLLYEYFLNRLKETSSQQGMHTADSRVLSNAVLPLEPNSPKTSMLLALSSVLGALVGVGTVVILELRQTAFRTAKELEAMLGVPVLGELPVQKKASRGHVVKQVGDTPLSLAGEAVRGLKTALTLSDLDKPPQVIMVTSSVPGEGKTTSSFLLAQSYAQMGKRVLLLETDLRRQVFSHYLDVMPNQGLVDLLQHDLSLHDVAVHDPATGADVVVAGQGAEKAVEMFASDRFAAFVRQLRDQYHVIIFDTPPCLLVSETRTIGRYADALLYLVRWNRTRQAEVEAGLETLANAGLDVTGLALTLVDPARAQSYADSAAAYSRYAHQYYVAT